MHGIIPNGAANQVEPTAQPAVSSKSNLFRAMKALNPKKKWLVRFTETETYTTEVEANSQAEAEALAHEEWNNGEIKEDGNSEATITYTEELH